MRKAITVGVLAATLIALTAPARADDVIRIAPRPGRVALTFDDGPHPRWTPVVLEILEDHGVVATFFVQGWKVERYPEIARAIVEGGHSLQNHTYGHERLPDLSDRLVRQSIRHGNRAIMRATGVAPTCLRPSYGATSPRVDAIARMMGVEPLIWDVDSYDYAHRSPRRAVEVLADLRSGDVVLMHDPLGDVWAAGLPRLIEHVRSLGLGFDTICEPIRLPPARML